MPTVTVARNDPAGAGLRLLHLAETLPDHRRAGQCLSVALPGASPAYFALASVPGDPAQLLVKDQGETGRHLARLHPGDRIEVSPTLGEGFALERVRERPLVVLCTGSAISAGRPVVLGEIAARLPRPVHLLYGVLAPDHLSFTDDLETWAAAGVQVHVVVAEEGSAGWRGPTGFVQDVAEDLGLLRSDVGVVLAGVPEMIEDARARYLAAGCPPEHLLLNIPG